jgi:hypothetical protein
MPLLDSQQQTSQLRRRPAASHLTNIRLTTRNNQQKDRSLVEVDHQSILAFRQITIPAEHLPILSRFSKLHCVRIGTRAIEYLLERRHDYNLLTQGLLPLSRKIGCRAKSRSYNITSGKQVNIRLS